MARSHGKNSYISVDTVNLTTYVDNIDVNKSKDVAETSAMGQNSKTYVTGLKEATITISGRWDDTATTGPDAVLAAAYADEDPVAIEYGPEGNSTGEVKVSASAICTSFNRTSSLGDVVAFTADFQVTGDVTEGTFA